ncbi:MAG: ribonuclease III [Alphaproteobacteria bacterium]|nr:ribonuclease III [Alphaproteobacteria bacterium]
MTAADLSRLEARIGWTFTQRGLLEEALIHASAAEGRRDVATNERLEFLGDRVLGLVVAQHLWAADPSCREADLALRLNALVNRTACARAARAVDLGAALTLSKAEEASGGRDKDTILADACEAVIAALYLDGGLDAARAFVIRAWGEALAAGAKAVRDPKTALQEWAAARRLDTPVYVVEGRVGPDHAPRFVVEVRVGAVGAARGEGGSKRDAERAAAAALLEKVAPDVG